MLKIGKHSYDHMIESSVWLIWKMTNIIFNENDENNGVENLDISNFENIRHTRPLPIKLNPLGINWLIWLYTQLLQPGYYLQW